MKESSSSLPRRVTAFTAACVIVSNMIGTGVFGTVVVQTEMENRPATVSYYRWGAQEVLMRKTRRNFTGAEKVAMLREHLVERVPISEVCEKRGVQPTLFYQWQKKLFQEGASVLERSRGPFSGIQADDARRMAALEDKLRERNEAVAELLGEYVALKRALVGLSPSPSGLAPKR